MKNIKPSQLLKEAQSISKRVESWADLSNALFDPYVGILTLAYVDKDERRAFMKTPEYRKIRELVEKAKDKFGLIEGATPTPSGKLVVRMPKSLHATLKLQAQDEGVSLNQLILCKLAMGIPMPAASAKTLSREKREKKVA